MTQDLAKTAVYREQQVMTASPIERIIIVYDVALTACASQQLERALRAVSLLRSGLDWDAAPELAPRLQAIYEYCEECLRAADFATPESILRDLRDTWAQARRQLGATSQRPSAMDGRPGTVQLGMGALNLAG